MVSLIRMYVHLKLVINDINKCMWLGSFDVINIMYSKSFGTKTAIATFVTGFTKTVPNSTFS